jgi:TnpA family transposase
LVVCRALNRSLDAETEIAALAKLLDGAYRTVADRAASNSDLRFETVDGKTRIVVTPLDRLEDTEGLRALRLAVQGRMPKAGMPDLFLEIMQRTGFAKAFTHLSERQARVEHFDTSLCAVLVAEACNIGIEAVSRQDVPALRRERLAWVSQNFIRPETIAAASAWIVSAHAALPLVKIWGAGDVASADGMRFTAPSSAIHSDAVFGLFWLLGYQFSPRLADLGDARLWRIDRKADYGPFNSVSKGTINLPLIRENWPDVIRLAGSLKLGHLKAAGIMRTLQVKDKPTTLARALSEIGRIAKTIHILHYIDDAAFRRRILTQLNHTELRHRLGRRIHHGERGEIRSPLQQGQEEQLGALGLALNAVVHWNAIYMQEAIRQVRSGGMDISNDDIAHLSPLIWRHLNFLGRYDFSLPDTVMNGGLRPLRNPTSAWDF